MGANAAFVKHSKLSSVRLSTALSCHLDFAMLALLQFACLDMFGNGLALPQLFSGEGSDKANGDHRSRLRVIC
jgi:hypothetical protein